MDKKNYPDPNTACECINFGDQEKVITTNHLDRMLYDKK
jgi:hypothetical protein